MNTLGTVLLALLFPIGWGLLTAWGFDWLRARWKRQHKEDQGR
jgi:hypothetical protein